MASLNSSTIGSPNDTASQSDDIANAVQLLLCRIACKEEKDKKVLENAEKQKKLFEDKVECLKNEIKTYKHEISSLQEELKTEKQRSNLYKTKFMDIQHSLYVKTKRNKELEEIVKLLTASNQPGFQMVNKFPFAIRNVPSAEKKAKGNRIVLAQDTCSYQIPDTMDVVSSPPEIPNSLTQHQFSARIWKNSQQPKQSLTTFKDDIVTSDDSFSLSPPKKITGKRSLLEETFFDPDETRLPANALKSDSEESDNGGKEDKPSTEQLSIPDTPEMEKSRLVSHKDVDQLARVESDRSPSLLPATTKSNWLRHAKKRAKLKANMAAVAKKRKLEESCSENKSVCKDVMPQDSLNLHRKKLEKSVAISPIKSPHESTQSLLISQPFDARDEEDDKLCRSFDWDDIFNKTEGHLETTTMMKERENNIDAEDVKENKSKEKEILDAVPPKDGLPTYKYETVTRGRAERDKLDGKACAQCEAYYSDLPSEERAIKLKEICRHKKVHHPPSTPECYWELGIPNTEECIRRGYITNETTQLAVATRSRANRRKPYKSRFPTKSKP